MPLGLLQNKVYLHMRRLLIIIATVFGLLTVQQHATGASGRIKQAIQKGDAFFSTGSRQTSFAGHVPVARVLVSSTQRRDHRAMDGCFLPAAATLSYTYPTHTPIKGKQPAVVCEQKLRLLFPQHYFW